MDNFAFSECDIDIDFRLMNQRKAPNMDGINADIALKTYEEVPNF